MDQKLQYQKSLELSQQHQPKHGTATKLPKLTITKFNGSYANWLPFWNEYEAEIDSTDINPVTKFAYLKELVEPKVRGDIDGLPFTTEGYERAKNILKSEYGRTSEIVNAYIQNIMDLPTVNGTQPAKVHGFYKTLLYNVQSLETLGKLERVNGMVRSVLEKLKGVKADLVGGDESWQDWDLSQLLVALKKWKNVNPVERSETQGKYMPPKRPAQSRSQLYHAMDNEHRKRGACVYCEDANHASSDCTRVVTVDERKKFLSQKRLCFNCTGAKHRAAECRSKISCQKCHLKHHTSICIRGQQLMTATGASEGPLVYPLVVVNVEGVTCRALLDTGAGSSYASDALLSLLSKRKPRKEVRRIEMMLGAVTKQVELSTITVKTLDGRFQMNVNVTKVNKRELLMLDNPNYQKLIQSYHHLKGVQMEDNDPKPQLPVHLILGVSDYLSIKTDEPPRVGQSGQPVAEKTKFGWTTLARNKEINCTAMLLTQTSQSDYEELCRLDVLGLADTPEHLQNEDYA